jgi:alpha-glucuronidase
VNNPGIATHAENYFKMKKYLILASLLLVVCRIRAEDGYRLWLRYDKVDNPTLLLQYRRTFQSIAVFGTSATINAVKDELQNGLSGLLDKKISCSASLPDIPSVIAGTVSALPGLLKPADKKTMESLGDEGFLVFSKIIRGKPTIIITANNDIGVLYGAFSFLRLLQTQKNIQNLNFSCVPKIKIRVLNHWDNLSRTVERGYAGISLWDWHKLPGYIDRRYIDYARANASVGINGTVLTNVNANAMVLTPAYLIKVKALADVFRPYGIKVYLTARFSAPVEIGGLKTADPLDEDVQQWWKRKVDEIYSYIPDFGGLLVKANSEGQPGPQNYGRTHADGANMLADALAPHKGIVMWRAFVYSNETPDDRFKQAYNEFKLLDGKFRNNVLVQVKNGPIDFQPREPFHPLFGAMPKTPLMMEFQLTQEYLGFATHLVFLPALFKETLDADTYAKGKNSTVARIIEGSLDNHELSGIAGVANIGNDINWCGHPFGQANWYGFGRLAWNDELSPAQIADEWIRQTFTNKQTAVNVVKEIMLSSRESLVNYMTPLGLHHIMGYGNHYGPAPWYDKASRADWNPVYFHKADSAGIGFDRTETGSNALAQFFPETADQWKDLKTCDEKYLLWFHHVPWKYPLKSGKSLWEELCIRYNSGVDSVKSMQTEWNSVEKYIDRQRFQQVAMLLNIQADEARWWRNSCLLYFQTFSKQPVPAFIEQPDHTLEYYESLRFPYAPGTGN